MQIYDRTTTGMHWQRHKHGREHQDAAGKTARMPVAAVIGTDPAVAYSATAPLPSGVDEMVLAGFLRGQGVNRLPNLLLTHGDLRHAGGVEVIAEQFFPEQITTSSVRSRSASYRAVTDRIEPSPQRWRQVNRSDTLAGWKILHPEVTDRFAQGDDNTVVLRGEFHGARILLLSDLGKLGQRALLEREKDLRAVIVIASLPTQGEPLNDTLLEAIQPRVIIIQDSEFPASRRASRVLRERLAQRPVPVFYTTTSGSLTLRIEPHGWELRTAEGEFISW